MILSAIHVGNVYSCPLQLMTYHIKIQGAYKDGHRIILMFSYYLS